MASDTTLSFALEKLPAWYQELSNEQVYLLENLHTYFRNDTMELFCPQTCKFLDDLGVYPPFSVLTVATALQKSNYRPILFLQCIAEELKNRVGDKLTGNEFSANERLIYSSICHLLYPELITKLEALLPSHKIRKVETPPLFQYIPPAPKISSPYLSIPEILLKQKMIAVEHNKRVKEKRKPLIALLTEVTYKQDIISEMINNEIVCDPKLKYQYSKGKGEYEILKKKFYLLEDERESLESKLFPQYKFVARQLKFETFELLEKSKSKRGKAQQAQNHQSDPHGGSISSFKSSSSSGILIDDDKHMKSSNHQIQVSQASVGKDNEKYNDDTSENTDDNKTISQDQSLTDLGESSEIDTDGSLPDESDMMGSSSLLPSTDSSDSNVDSSQLEVIQVSSDIEYDVSESEFKLKLIRFDPQRQLDVALTYLTYKNKYLELLPSLRSLPRLRYWYAKKIKLPGDNSTLQFKTPKADFFEERLQAMKNTRIVLPKIEPGNVDRKSLIENIERITGLFTRQLKLKEIEISRELFTLYNYESLPDIDKRQFKRVFFSIFPNREKDILVKA